MVKIQNREQIDCLSLKRSRKKINLGDVFAMRISDGFYIFGQVIATDINSYDGAIDCMVVFYKLKSNDLYLPKNIDSLNEVEFLIDMPFLVNKVSWTSGIFQNVANFEVPDKIKPYFFESFMKDGVVDVQGNLVEEYPKERVFSRYGISPLGVILKHLKIAFDQSPEWFEI